ncbi:hypothetical protein [Bradyrhizobium liaoningense]|uniref:hypothetical protein n=1 Tax=Bradyrhizobium liaoningense TaxID=43992 RepID=UPI001BAAD582|nr:hypothetical protein [Bradyrhizobium liaoningense]MBR0907357.1 hypothetical protein [Bradyrhizobium liaoningense]
MGDAGATTMETSGAYTTTMKAAASTAGVCIIGNETDGDQNHRRQSSEKASKHGFPPLLGVPRMIRRCRSRIGTRQKALRLLEIGFDLNQGVKD